MALIVVGVSHHGASLEVRERLAYRTSEVHGILDRVRTTADVREAVLLSTCNRTELYVIEGEREAAPAVWSLYAERLGGDASAWARSKVLFATTAARTPSACSDASASSAISPAPSTIARRPASEPKICFASCTAAELTDAAPRATAVSFRTRPATSSDV